MRINKLLSSFAELGDTIESIIAGVGQEMILNDEQEYKIRLVMNELVMNIFKYSDADKVSVCADYYDMQLKIQLEDNGSGFESKKITERNVQDENLLMCESGRGVFLVKIMADSLKYSEVGNAVAVTLKLD
ncbi:MAG: ATP-binding protein [Christensenella sp.]|uniref:ATP-binding protein n=1 Tax=Christensenella sp. TaxID=1935934 RepID=UPI002B20FC80|nr:ATP-binding protein [Christensenella sp.]MEA5004579.1 ATP-binding protein [Christensenella sp.]